MPFIFVYVTSTLKYDYEYNKYMASATPPPSPLEDPVVTAAAETALKRPPITAESESSTIFMGTWLEQEDTGAISCDEDSFDEIFRSAETTSLEETTCPPFEPEVPVNSSTNTDPTFPLLEQPVSSSHINAAPEDRSLLRSYTQ
jgi:hypothetical protein